jgi:hypothetical protein
MGLMDLFRKRKSDPKAAELSPDERREIPHDTVEVARDAPERPAGEDEQETTERR